MPDGSSLNGQRSSGAEPHTEPAVSDLAVAPRERGRDAHGALRPRSGGGLTDVQRRPQHHVAVLGAPRRSAPAARTALNEGDYGAGTPLIRDGAFERNIYHSWAGDPALIMDLRASGSTLSSRSSR